MILISTADAPRETARITAFPVEVTAGPSTDTYRVLTDSVTLSFGAGSLLEVARAWLGLSAGTGCVSEVRYKGTSVREADALPLQDRLVTSEVPYDTTHGTGLVSSSGGLWLKPEYRRLLGDRGRTVLVHIVTKVTCAKSIDIVISHNEALAARLRAGATLDVASVAAAKVQMTLSKRGTDTIELKGVFARDDIAVEWSGWTLEVDSATGRILRQYPAKEAGTPADPPGRPAD